MHACMHVWIAWHGVVNTRIQGKGFKSALGLPCKENTHAQQHVWEAPTIQLFGGAG